MKWLQSELTKRLMEGGNNLIYSAKVRPQGFNSRWYLLTKACLTSGKLVLKLPPLKLATHME